MNSQRILGIVLMVAGVVLWIIGVNASDSVADRWSNFFTGQFTDSTTWYILGGIALSIVGAGVAFTGGRARAR